MELFAKSLNLSSCLQFETVKFYKFDKYTLLERAMPLIENLALNAKPQSQIMA